jgi:segregation and condensation protein A
MEYERFKQAAQDIDALPRLERDCFPVHAAVPAGHVPRIPPTVELNEVLRPARGHGPRRPVHQPPGRARIAVAARAHVAGAERCSTAASCPSWSCSTSPRAAPAWSSASSPILELVKAATLELVQSEPYAPIHVRLRQVDA